MTAEMQTSQGRFALPRACARACARVLRVPHCISSLQSLHLCRGCIGSVERKSPQASPPAQRPSRRGAGGGGALLPGGQRAVGRPLPVSVGGGGERRRL